MSLMMNAEHLLWEDRWVQLARSAIISIVFVVANLAGPAWSYNSSTARDQNTYTPPPRYTQQANGIRLPPSAERLIVRKAGAKYVTYVSQLIFFPAYDRHFLGVSVSVVPGKNPDHSFGPAWEGIWHLEFVLCKSHLAPTWDHATIYSPNRHSLRDLLTMPIKQFFQALGDPLE